MFAINRDLLKGSGNEPTFGLLDSDSLHDMRRSIFKAICIPGHQVPYASRDMPIARGFGTGGLQATLTLLEIGDTVKVIDQGADDSVNAINLRRLVASTCQGVDFTTETKDASIIQTRHRIPERLLREEQILVLQVPYPDPLVLVEPNAVRRRMMHGIGDYSKLLVKLYEDMVSRGEVNISHRYPTRIANHYVIDPSPIPRYDIPKLNHASCLSLFAAGRERRIYAVPPYTDAKPLTFEDVPFQIETFTSSDGISKAVCRRCGATGVFFDEFQDGDGQTVHQCSDSNYCDTRLREGRP